MALETTPKECPQAQNLLGSMDYHLFVAASFADYQPAHLYVDNLEQPRAAFLWSGQRGYITGNLSDDTFQETVLSVVFQPMPASIRIYADEEWKTFIQKKAPQNKNVKLAHRQYYSCAPEARKYSRSFSDEISITWLGMPLLGQELKIENHHLLEAAILSTNPSYEEFLNKGWGICALHMIPGHGNYAGWCLAENTVQGRCEVGIKTLPSFQRQGIAKAMVDRFVSTAHELEFRQIGWHCWEDNIASAKTAIKSGFQLEHEYSVLTIE